MKIAIVRALDGHTTICGPDDHSDDYGNPMDAALSWHIESGHLPAECLWVEVELPPIPDIAEVRAKAERGEFPRSFIEELDADAAAQAIEARRAETGTGSVEDESAVAEGDAP